MALTIVWVLGLGSPLRAEGLGDDDALIIRFDASPDVDVRDAAAALRRLLAAGAFNPDLMTAIDKLRAPANSGILLDNVPLSLAFIDYPLQRDINAALMQSDKAPTDSAARLQSLARDAQDDLKRLKGLPGSPARATLEFRLQALQDLALSGSNAAAVMRDTASLLEKLLSVPRPDGRAIALALHAWAFASQNSSPEKTAEKLDAWLIRARAILPDQDPASAAMAVDVADRAVTAGDHAVARRVLGLLASSHSALPRPLVDVFEARELAEMTDEIQDPALASTFRFRLFRALLTASRTEASTRRLLLAIYDPLKLAEPDATIEALGQALASTRAEADLDMVKALKVDLAILLGRQGRGGEVEIRTFDGLGSEEIHARLAKATAADVRSLLDKTGQDISDEPLADILLFSRAVDLSGPGSGVADLSRAEARMGLIRALDEAGLKIEAVDRLNRFGEEIYADRSMDIGARKWFFEEAAGWAAKNGLPNAGFFRSREVTLPAQWEWIDLEKLVANVGPLEDVQRRFIGGVRLMHDLGPLGAQTRILDQDVPRYAGLLARPENNDQTDLFARPYERALDTTGQSRLAGIVASVRNLPYPLFCQIMVAAGDARFATAQAACKGTSTAALDDAGAERDRVAAAYPAEPAVEPSETSICDALSAAAKGASINPLDLTRRKLWLILGAIQRSGKPTSCFTGTGLGTHGAIVALAQTYVGAAPRLNAALYAESAERSTSVLAKADTVGAASTAGHADSAIDAVIAAATDRTSGLPLLVSLSQWSWHREKVAPVVDRTFPQEASILKAIDDLAGTGTTDRLDVVDRGLAAAPAALYRSEIDGWSDAFEPALKARSTPANDTTAALLAATAAATADAWLVHAHVGRDAARPLYVQAGVLAMKAVARSDIPFVVKSALLETRRTFAGWELAANDPDPAPQTCLPPSDSFGPFSNPDRGPDPTCTEHVWASWIAKVRAGGVSGATPEQLFGPLQTIVATLGDNGLARLPPDIARSLIASVKVQRPPEQQSDLETMLLRAADRTTALRRSAVRQAWIAASRRLDRAVSAGLSAEALSLLAQQADAAWRADADSSRAGEDASADEKTAVPHADWNEVEAALRPDEAIVVYLTDSIDAAVVVRHTGTAIVPLPAGGPALADEVLRYRSAVAPKPRQNLASDELNVALGHRLYTDLLAPVTPELAGVRTLYLDVPLTLAALPFPALVKDAPPQGRWLTADPWTPDWLERHLDIAFIADPEVLALERRVERPARPPRVLAAGDPLLAGAPAAGTSVDAILKADSRERAALVRADFEALPEAKAEIASLSALQPKSTTTLSGPTFTNSRLAAAVSPDVTHVLLATHAATSSRSDAAMLITSPADGADDGVMDVDAVKGLPLDADLVVLSACQTGASAVGQTIFGSLTSAFQDAGARQVVATLWPVLSEAEEAVTVRTMTGVLRDHMSPAASLAAAMRAVADGQAGPNARHPGSWSSFILVGAP